MRWALLLGALLWLVGIAKDYFELGSEVQVRNCP